MYPFIGTIQLFPYSFTPAGWLPCDGQVVSINTYSGLATMIGNTFGGDGYSTFALPKLLGPGAGLRYFIYVANSGSSPPRG